MARLSVSAVRPLEAPAHAAALAGAVLAAARTRSEAILCTYTLSGDVLSLGRFHRVPAESGTAVRLARRLTGGRAAPAGDGFVGLLLALPHAEALVPDAPPDLGPERLLNRCVRGLLGALESLGARAYYPGRDRVTVDGRTIATLGLEVEADGATLVEASVAVGRSFASVSALADRADPAGVVPVDLMLPAEGTSLAEAAGHAPAAGALDAALAAGYAARLGVEVTPDAAPPAPAPEDPAWLAAGRLAPHLDRHALARDMLGAVEVYAARRDDRVGDVRVCGDLIAPSGTVAALEDALRGAPLAREALRARAEAVLAAPGAFVLGVRSPATVVADLVLEACAT